MNRQVMAIPLARPDIGPEEERLVLEVLRSGQLSLGPMVPEFERRVAEYVGAGQAVAVSSGTAGLHLCVRALGLGPGDEVITTPFSFVASANCLLFEGVRPVFVDIDPVTWNIDPERVEAAVTPCTRAILAVHVFGQTCAMDAILDIARRRGLEVIEDACEALGGTYRGRYAGTFGRAGVFAFYPNKQITTGEGGMIVTDDASLARACRSMRNQGRGESGAWLEHERLGYNYRMDELSAALGVAQMARLDEILAARARVAAYYDALLADVPGVRPISWRPEVGMSWFVYVVLLPPDVDRDRVIAGLREAGVECRPYFSPIHLQPFYRERFGHRPGDFPVCEDVSRRTLALPFHTRLSPGEAEWVVKSLREVLEGPGRRHACSGAARKGTRSSPR